MHEEKCKSFFILGHNHILFLVFARYTLFWTTLIISKLAFSYYVEVSSPMHKCNFIMLGTCSNFCDGAR